MTITTPNSNPFASGDTSLIIGGQCETDATVDLVGADVQSATCVNSTFSFTVTPAVDGTYDYTLSQTDLAGNASPLTAFEWVKDSTIPPTPTIDVPASAPFYSNLSQITISGTCTTGYDVLLGGDVAAADVTSPAGSLLTPCSGNLYSFTLTKSVDATYNFTIEQDNSTTGASSNSVSTQWILDTAPPANPVILNPPSSSYTAGGNLTLAGTCEAGATVAISGDDTQSAICSSSGTYSFTILENIDRVYSFGVSQTDPAGNASGSVAQTWTRNSSVLPAPTITSPSTNPFTSNTASLVISGGCVTGYTVTLGGDAAAGEMITPAGSASASCVNSAYTFEISKALDGSYQFTVSQSDGFTSSPLVSQSWTRDTTVPVVSITSQPANPNLVFGASLAFSATESVRFECSLDSGAWATCVSPLSYASIANGPHSLDVRGTDLAGNTSSIVTASWTQASNKAVALYHLDDGTYMNDSSLNAGALNNSFTTDSGVGTSASVSGAYSQARSFANTMLSAPDSATFGTISGTMTAEAWVKLTSSTFSGYVVIMGQHAASPNMGWELKIKKQGANLRVAVAISLNGTTVTEISSSNQNTLLNNWKHVAVTFNLGTVKIYLNGAQVASGTVGTAGSSRIFNSASVFRVGKGSAGNAFTGLIDEVRVSQVVRYLAPFTAAVPSSPFSAD